MSRLRDQEGKFVECSNLGKTYGVKFYIEDESKLVEIARKKNIATTALVRLAIKEWLEAKNLEEKQASQ